MEVTVEHYCEIYQHKDISHIDALKITVSKEIITKILERTPT